MIRITQETNNPSFLHKVKKLTPEQTENLINALQTSSNMKEVAKKTNLTEERIRRFCKNKLGKKYSQIKRESIAVMLQNTSNNKIVSQKLDIKESRVKLIRYGSKKVHKEDLIIRSLKEQYKYLWDKGLSIESIAEKTNSDYNTVFNYLTLEAQKKGPWVG